ncbi:MAG: squalene/phytoene synthase family protein [Pseudobdellovibrionaceae bacterium]
MFIVNWMQSVNFYQNHLDKVSRSFSFCIARLDAGLRVQVSLSYLLLRVLDSIEDAHWPSFERQRESFEVFNQFLLAPPQELLWRNWLQEFPQTLPQAEMNLLADSLLLFQDLCQFSHESQKVIRNSVLNMSRGMMFFLGNKDSKRGLHLMNLEEVNGYCFFVAGIVGELLTDLVGLQKIYVQAIHFGLFLQKINILKDQLADEKEGRYLVPSRSELMISLRENAQGAVNYLLAIPLEEKGYRLFCAWSLFLGLASVSWIQKSWLLKALEKIPRSLTLKLLTQIEEIIDDNSALSSQFQELVQDLPFLDRNELEEPNEFGMEKVWISYEKFRELYSGRLTLGELSEVGLFRSYAF